MTSRQPARNATATPRSTAVTVGFSQAISATSANNLRVFSAQRGGRLAGSVGGGGTTSLTLAPGQPFVAGDVLNVSLPASLTSTGGTALARQVYQFTAATGGGGRGFFGDTTVVGNTGNRDQVLGDLDNDGDLDLVTTGALYGCRFFLNDGSGRFTFKTGLVAAQTPSGVALADVDGDGDLDLLVGDYDNGLVSVCINDGAANFIGSVTGAQNAPVGRHPVSVAAGDIDGDGDLDFVTANNGDNSATVRFNNGSLPLLYTSASTVALGASPTAVVLADVDNDGDLDLLTSNAGPSSAPSGSVTLCRNSGTGSFGSPVSFAVGLQPSELVLADVDGDGDLDLLTANAGSATVTRLLNNGSGTFASSATISLPAGSTPSGLRAGDVDGDGDLDLLVAQGTGGRVFTCLNTSGSFAVQARPLRLNRAGTANPVQSVGVTLGDLDGDFDLDLITSDEHGKVLGSLNLGSLPALPAPTITGLNPASGPVGSTVTITGTGLVDVAGVFFNGVPAPGFLLNGAGTGLTVAVPVGATSGVVTVVTEEAGTATSPTPFTVVVPVPVLLTNLVPARNAVAAPRNGGVAATFSVPVTAATASNLRVFGNLHRGRRPGTVSGGGTSTLTFTPNQPFAPGELLSVSLPSSLQAADGNQVTKKVVQFTAAVGGTGRHDFITRSVLTVAGAGSFRAGDLDNDGDVDLATPGGTQGVLFQLNDGTGNFVAGQPLTGPSNAYWVTLGDVDADGDLDLLSADTYTTGTVWLNNGSGGFASGSTFSFAAYASSLSGDLLTLADVDADGDPDLVVVVGSQVLTLLNNGAGSFAAPLLSYINVSALKMTMGDVDSDGDLDLLVTGRDSQNYDQLTVNLNDGNGRFATAAALTKTTSNGRQIALGDLDGDGDLDLALQCSINYTPQVLMFSNDGTGNYGTAAASVLLDGAGLALGDTDADGDLDVVTYAGVGVNNGTGSFALALAATNATSATNVVLADLDGDLDLDELCEDNYRSVLVKLNRPGPPPTLADLRPSSGPVGSPVLLTGTNLQTTAAVSFNGVPAISFTVLAGTQVVATVPPGATSGPVVLTTPAGTASPPTPFSVTQPLAATLLSPARNMGNAPRPPAVSITFARPVSAASAGELRVFSNRRSGPAAGTVTASGSSIMFAPARPLAAGERLSVSVPDRLAGTDGSRAERQVFEFTMAAGGTGTGLLLPADGGQPAAFRSPGGFALGDLDRDGDLDVLSNTGIGRFNDGEGAFPDSTVLSDGYFAGDNARHVATADLNGDGYFDLLSTAGTEYLNNQHGGFTPEPALGGFDDDTRDLALGDLDADGDLDLVAPNYARDSVRVLFNDGTGHFTTRLRVAVGSHPTSISLGDVDNDGDLDFITANAGTGSSTLSVALNNGIGLFTSVQTTAAGSGLLRVALGDLDGDHDLDLATNNGIVRFNNGSGLFAGSQTTPSGTDLALGDLDGDGDLDLLVSSASTAAVRRNDGTGQFGGTETLNFGSGSQAHHPVLADLDDDGDLDLLVGDASTSTVRGWLNQRLAAPALLSFSPASGLPGATVVLTGTDLVGTTAVSFNGTAAPGFNLRTAGRIEVQVPAGATTGPVQVTNANGTATSATAFIVLSPIALTTTSPAANAVAPRTAPVVLSFGQAIATNTAANLAVFSQQRGGQLAGTRTGAGSATLTFVPTLPYVPGEVLSVSVPAYTTATQDRVQKRVFQFRAAVGGTGRGFMSSPLTSQSYGQQTILGDVDGDGDADVLLLSSNRDVLSLQRNDGTGSFASTVTVFASSNGDELNGIALGDFDGDGDLDLAIGNNTTNQVHLRRNNGTGSFAAAQDIAVGDYPQRVTLADVDGDGDLDLLTANAGLAGMSLSVRYNDGSGQFNGTASEMLNAVGSMDYTSLNMGDMDGDGDLDLVLGYGGEGYVRLNDGQGHFPAGIQLVLSQDISGTIELADVDNDHDLDVLGLSWYDSSGQRDIMGRVWVNVSTNNGAGQFTRGGFWANQSGEGLAVGDVDADGDPDVLVTSGYRTSALEYRNDGQGSFTLAQTFAIAGPTYRPTLGDMDGDGDLDFVFVSPALTVFFNGPLPLPVISSFTPASGPAGTSVAITGSWLTGALAVQFNGTNAPGFQVSSATSLSVNVPNGATTGRITVTTPTGTATSATNFTVLPTIVPLQLTPAPNALAVPRTAAVAFTFPAAVTAASAGNLRVFGSQLRGRRAGVLSGAGTAALSFAPSQSFAPGEQISVTLPGTMLTATGAQVRSQVYQFTAATGGTGQGGFVPGPLVAVPLYALVLAVGDLDNDGDLDLLTSSETGQSPAPAVIAVRLNNGQGQFSAGTAIATTISEVNRLLLGDVDGDGDLDVLVGAGAQGVQVSLNSGNATFSSVQLPSLRADQLALGDMDGDGDLDLVAADNFSNGRITIATNDGLGQFTYVTPGYNNLSAATDMALGDVDGDGDLDVVTASSSLGAQVLLNTGTTALSLGVRLPMADDTSCLALADFDGDGDLDLVLGSLDTNNYATATLWTNDSTGVYASTNRPMPMSRGLRQLVAGDIDHDGDLDMLGMGQVSPTSLSLRLNNGAGRFAGTASLPTTAFPTRLALGDLDGNGDLDFALAQASSASSEVEIRFNNGVALASTQAQGHAADVSVYPNPTAGRFAVVVPQELRPVGPASLQLYNALGQLVLEQAWQPAIGEQTVDAAHLPPGLYTLRLGLRNGPVVRKVVLR